MTDASVFPLPHANRAVLARKAAVQRHQHTANLSDLWQLVFEIVSTSADPGTVLNRLAGAVGTAFQVDGCLLLMAEQNSLMTEETVWLTGCWVADGSRGSCQPMGATFQPMTLEDWTWLSESTVVSCSIAEVALTGELTVDRECHPLVALWQKVGASESNPLPVRSILGVPTQFQGNTNGMVSLMRSHSHTWTESEIETLKMATHQVAMALSHLQLQHQLGKQMQYQTVVNQLTMAIRNASDLNEILKFATNDTAQVLQAQRGLLLRLKYWDPLFRDRPSESVPRVRVTVIHEWEQASENSNTTPASNSNLDSGLALDSTNNSTNENLESVLHWSFWLSECALCQTAFAQRSSPTLVSDPSQLPAIESSSGVASVFAIDKLPSLLIMPLESQGTVLGLLVFQHSSFRRWQPQEVELVELVAAQVSTAMIQTETLRQVQALVEKRTAELQQSLAVQAKLYERTRQQIDQLRHLNQLKDEFLSTVSHELRTPLTSMTMAIRMLRQIEPSDERRDRYLDILEQQCTQETNLVNDLLALQELETNQIPIQLQNLDLKALVEEITQPFQQKWMAKGLSLVLDLPTQPLQMQSDRDSLWRVLLELLTNAGKYSEPNSEITIHIAPSSTSPNEVTLAISNVGPGISPDELPHIFDKFRRAQGATQNAIQGTGLGLALVKCLVQHLGGTITVSSCPTDRVQSCTTSFTLTLPRFFDSIKL